MFLITPIPKDGGIVSLRYFYDPRLIPALVGEVLIQTFAKLRSVHSYDVVYGGIVIRGPSENFESYFLLMYLYGRVFEDPITEVQEEVPQTGGLADIAGRNHSLYELFPACLVCRTIGRL